MTINEKTFWLDTIEIPTPAARDFPQQADVAIIGAGFTGLSAARTLAKSGASVAVFDAQTIGWGASSRNGGMVLTGLKLPASTLIARYGKEATARMYAASLESIDFVEKLVREENIACDFARCGHLEVACKPKHFDDFRRSAEETARHFNHRQRMIFDSKNYLYYYRLTPDRRMLFGGRAAFFPETSSTIRRSAEILRRGMLTVYPQLRDAKIEYVWGGTLDFAFDIMPHAGQLDGLHFSLGYAGHGVGMSTYLGDKIAQSILHGRSEDSSRDKYSDGDGNPFARIPFPGAPLNLYNGRPWFLPAGGLWYELLDWIS